MPRAHRASPAALLSPRSHRAPGGAAWRCRASLNRTRRYIFRMDGNSVWPGPSVKQRATPRRITYAPFYSCKKIAMGARPGSLGPARINVDPLRASRLAPSQPGHKAWAKAREMPRHSESPPTARPARPCAAYCSRGGLSRLERGCAATPSKQPLPRPFSAPSLLRRRPGGGPGRPSAGGAQRACISSGFYFRALQSARAAPGQRFAAFYGATAEDQGINSLSARLGRLRGGPSRRRGGSQHT